MRSIYTSLVVLLLLVAGGCGGGGGGGAGGGSGPATPEGSLFGPYGYVRLTVNVGLTTHFGTSRRGAFEADGMGLTGEHAYWENANGSTHGPWLHSTMGYSVGPASVLMLKSGTFDMEGGVGHTGVHAALASLSPTNPGLMIALRRGGSFDWETLAGEYHLARFAVGTAGGVPASAWGSSTLKSNGEHSTLVDANVASVRVNGLDLSGFYAVSLDGAVSASFGSLATGGDSGSGFASVGGEALLLGGGQHAMTPPLISTLIRKSASASTGTFSGRYAMVRLERLDTGAWSTFRGTLEADGMGQATVSGDGIVDQMNTVFAPSAFSYTVQADGAMTLEAIGWTGSVAPSGDFAVLTGSAIAGRFPAMITLVRTAP